MVIIWVPLPISSLRFKVNLRVNFFASIYLSCTEGAPRNRRRMFRLKFKGYIGGSLILG